jgi:hypothetical protein
MDDSFLDLKSGDFLEDIEIEIVLRSGKTSFKVCSNLVQAIVASVVELLHSDAVLTETEYKIKNMPGKTLVIISEKINA